MEIIKSVLKKPDAVDPIKDKRVTFNNTVRVFIDDPKKSLIDNIKASQLNWIEISIVDKSADTKVSKSLKDDSSETDFLVHKVIYDNYVLPENDEDLDIHNKSNDDDEDIVLFETELDDGLEFVVHKVTEHEDDLIKKDADFALENENISYSEPEKVPEVIPENKNTFKSEKEIEMVGKFSKLSIENILQHDKIIAFIDQRNMGLSPLQATLNKTVGVTNKNTTLPEKPLDSLILSPPLQELSLEKIVKAHSDNILCELDISPLNSVQETDSDSDASSEGTMIMMTTEESEKNEQHIRESLMQYQSLKEKQTKAESKPLDHLSETTVIQIENDNIYNINETLYEMHHNQLAACNSDSTGNALEAKITEPSSFSNGCLSDSFPTDGHSKKKMYSSSLPDTESDEKHLQSKHLQVFKRTSSENEKHFKQNFTSVEIPHDVRDWKIHLDSLQRTDSSANQFMHSNNENECMELHNSFGTPPPQRPDELENFVHESTERIDRIRQRYHTRHKPRVRHTPPIRGIRPRFGSTAEILDMMQKQNNPPFISYNGTKNHMSWPCEETSSSSSNFYGQPNFYVSQHYSSECSSQSSIDSYCEDRLNTSSDQCSISSCPSVFIPEQGMNEDRSTSEMDDSFDSSKSDSFVYFSMKV